MNDSVQSMEWIFPTRVMTKRKDGNVHIYFHAPGLSHTTEHYRMLYGRPGESDEQRAFRRYPIDKHKPGYV